MWLIFHFLLCLFVLYCSKKNSINKKMKQESNMAVFCLFLALSAIDPYIRNKMYDMYLLLQLSCQLLLVLFNTVFCDCVADLQMQYTVV